MEAQSWPMAPRQCQQCLTDQIKPIDPQRNGAPAAREPLDRPGTIGTISRSMARADGEVGFEGVGTVALGQLSDGAVQPVSPGGGGEQP